MQFIKYFVCSNYFLFYYSRLIEFSKKYLFKERSSLKLYTLKSIYLWDLIKHILNKILKINDYVHQWLFKIIHKINFTQYTGSSIAKWIVTNSFSLHVMFPLCHFKGRDVQTDISNYRAASTKNLSIILLDDI